MSILRACLVAIGLVILSAGAVAQTEVDQGWPPGERVLAKYRAGKYAEVIAEGPAVLDAEPWNNDLRLAVANSMLWSGREWDAVDHFRLLLETPVATDARLGLANGLSWTGRMAESVPHYTAILDDTAYWALFKKAEAGAIPFYPALPSEQTKAEAKLGLANAQRWMARDHLAHPLYLQLRAAYPDKDIGADGEFYARRMLRPRTTLGLVYSQDNTPMSRNEPVVSHVWRDDSKSIIFGIDATGGRDWNDDLKLTRRDLTFRVESLDTVLAPRLSVTRQDTPEGKTFGDLRLEVNKWPLFVNVGRINWGKLAFTIPALELGLAANRYGLEGKYQVGAGELRGFVNHFDISDGNTVDNAELRLTSRWRPFGKEIKPFVGAHWRQSDHVDPNYWSPERYGLGYVGLEGEWEHRQWYVYAQGQVGFKLAGEANTAWAANLIAKRWIGADWSVGVVGFAQGGTRGTNYRAEGVSLLVEKLW